MKILILLLSSVLVINCSGNRDEKLGGLHFPYVIDMHQGNIIDDADVAKLQLGMSKEAVKSILGEPLLVDTFNKNRWDYVQIDRIGKGRATKKSISLFFNDNGLFEVRR